MTPGSLSVLRWVTFLFLLNLPVTLPAADPVIGYGLTNIAIGQAQLSGDLSFGRYYVNNLRSNGLDGVSIHLGEPDSGVFFSPYTSYLFNGNYMVVKVYGHLHGTNDALVATIRGARASRQIYPLSFDYSPLQPESVTYQIFHQGNLQREFTRGTPMVAVDFGYGVYPTLNPLFRRSDGALGTSLHLNNTVDFVFPEVLDSASGDELFIRLNNPANLPGNLSRVDVFGGGVQLPEFTFNDLGLGVFGRRHQSVLGVTLEARPNWLRLGNFVNTNDTPGVLINLERLGAMNMQFEPFQIPDSDASLALTATGAALGDLYRALGTLYIGRLDDQTSIKFEQGDSFDIQIHILTNGTLAHVDSILPGGAIFASTNARIGAITVHSKTVENLPGFHVQFAEATPITIGSSNVITGDEVRLLLPYPVRMEHLHTLYLAGRGLGSLTLTNELATAPSGPAQLQIFHILGQGKIVMKWPDPNRLLKLWYSDRGLDSFYSPVEFMDFIYSDPYASATLFVEPTNTFFRLFYQPWE